MSLLSPLGGNLEGSLEGSTVEACEYWGQPRTQGLVVHPPGSAREEHTVATAPTSPSSR